MWQEEAFFLFFYKIEIWASFCQKIKFLFSVAYLCVRVYLYFSFDVFPVEFVEFLSGRQVIQE